MELKDIQKFIYDHLIKNNKIVKSRLSIKWFDLREFNDYTELADSNNNYFYFKESSNILHSRIKFQKHKLKNILSIFDNNLSESENMYNNNYRKIYDSGNKVFVLELEV